MNYNFTTRQLYPFTDQWKNGMHGDSVQVRNWTYTAGLDYIHYNFFLFNEGESVEETWTLDSKGSLSIGNVSISKDFEFFGLDVKAFRM